MSEKTMNYNRGWTPVEDGLPEYMTACLVYCHETENTYCAYYHFYSGSADPNKVPIWCFFDNHPRITEIDEKVSHWMKTPVRPVIFEGSEKITSCCGHPPIGASEDMGMCPECKEHCEYEEVES